MITFSKNTTVKNNLKSLGRTRFSNKYISQFESAVQNFEQIIEEEKIIKNKAVHMRLASNFQ